MDHKAENKKTYDLFSKEFDVKFENHFYQFVKEQADLFLENINGKDIIDLGSGPGNHALYFSKRGFNVLCTDFSELMLNLCQEKGLATKYMDIEEWNLPEESADGIWAYASLLHVPKAKIKTVVKNIKIALKPKGIVALAVKEGEGEKFEENEKYPDTKRFFVYFNDTEILGYFGEEFELIRSSKTEGKKNTFLNYLFRKK